MADEKVEIVLDGKDAGVVRAWMAAKASVESFENALVKIDPAQQRNAESAKQFEKAAAAIFANTRTPLERYEASLAELNQLYIANKVNSETYNRAIKQLTETLHKEDGTTAALMATEKAEAEAAKRAAAEKEQAEARLLAQREAAAAQQERLEQQAAARSLAKQRAQAIEQEKIEQQAASRRLAAQKAMFLDGQRLTESVSTAQERHNQNLARFRNLLDQGAISQTTFNRAVKQSKIEMDQAGASGNAMLSSIKGQVLGIAGGWVSVQAGIQLATKLVEDFREANAKANKESQDAAREQENRRKQFQVQAGLGNIGGKEAQADLNKIAYDTATPNAQVNDIAKMLVSSGATEKAARGGGTKSIAEFIKAQALNGNEVNAQSFTDVITKYLLSQGQELNEENISSFVKKLQSQGIKSTKFKIPDLQYLASEGAAFKSFGLSMDEQLAQFAVTTNVLDPSKGSAQMREIIKNLAVAGSRPDRVKTLKKMGLSPKDVDMVGEDFPEVMKRLMTALEKLKPEERQGALDKLVEGANIGEFWKLGESLQAAAKVKAGLGDTKAFEADVKTMTTGREAADIRAKNRLETQKAAQADYGDLYRQAIETTEIGNGTTEYQRQSRLEWYDYYRSIGESPEVATLRSKPKNWFGSQDENAAAAEQSLKQVEGEVAANLGGVNVLNELKEMRRQAEETNKILRENANKAPQVEVKVNGVNAPSKVNQPKPVPAAALGGPG